jgi:hypothetical protein
MDSENSARYEDMKRRAEEFKQQVRASFDAMASARGEILKMLTETESLIESLLTLYIAQSDKHPAFATIIRNENVQTSVKITALAHMPFMSTHLNIIEKLRRMNRIRNIVAHNIPTADASVVDPRSGKPVKISSLVDECHTLHSEVDSVLWKLFLDMVNSADN